MLRSIKPITVFTYNTPISDILNALMASQSHHRQINIDETYCTAGLLSLFNDVLHIYWVVCI